MLSRQKESLYKDRIFGDDETPPRPPPSRPSHTYDDPSWFASEEKAATAEENTNDASAYIFNRNALSSARLNLQHQLFVSSVGFLLHPLIPIRSDMVVADIGCGTGIWSLQTSSTLPSGSKIEAFDISLAQTPPPQFSPPHVSFRQLDIFSPLPSDLLRRYDVVNIRLFMCVISSGDPMPLLHQLMKLLKPGGYLQWQEYDSSTDKIVLADNTTSAPNLQTLFNHIHPTDKPNITRWVKDFHTRFQEAGGELVRHERCWTGKESIILKQDISLLAVREWAANLKGKGQGFEAKGAEKLVKKAEEECWALGRGCFVDSEIVTWVARKQ